MTFVQKSDRVKIIHMPNDPNPIPGGSTGTVTRVTDGPLAQVSVDWDNGRSLSLVPGTDEFEVLEQTGSSSNAIQVPKAVLDGITAAKDSGLFNMLDLPAVTGLTRQLGFDEAADWLGDRDNRKTYAEGIFRGFMPEEE